MFIVTIRLHYFCISFARNALNQHRLCMKTTLLITILLINTIKTMKLIKSFVKGFFSIALLLLIASMAIGIAFFGAWHQIFLLVPTIGLFVTVRNYM